MSASWDGPGVDAVALLAEPLQRDVPAGDSRFLGLGQIDFVLGHVSVSFQDSFDIGFGDVSFRLVPTRRETVLRLGKDGGTEPTPEVDHVAHDVCQPP